ncbi:MAG: hypothetical protein NC223_01450 [Butyrivibrio sp.]|nr:hypothetical protein [Butyrivibrio sp.]
MDYMHEMEKIAKENGGIIDNKSAASVGISRAMLSKLCKEDKIQRLIRGQYILADDIQDELLSIELRSKQLIFSHETALFLHGISDRTPFEHSLTAPSNRVPSKAIRQDCKIYYIKPELFELGKIKLTTQFGNEVTGYDLERTICDVIRSRSKVGSETFLAALKMYALDSRKDLNKLNSYAKKMKIAGIVRKYMEVLL